MRTPLPPHDPHAADIAIPEPATPDALPDTQIRIFPPLEAPLLRQSDPAQNHRFQGFPLPAAHRRMDWRCGIQVNRERATAEAPVLGCLEEVQRLRDRHAQTRRVRLVAPTRTPTAAKASSTDRTNSTGQ